VAGALERRRADPAGYREWGYREWGYREWGYREWGYREWGYREWGCPEWGCPERRRPLDGRAQIRSARPDHARTALPDHRPGL
jgi:hypothetical protein